MILSITREELVDDIPDEIKIRETLGIMTDKAVINAWRKHGINNRTWDADTVEIREV